MWNKRSRREEAYERTSIGVLLCASRDNEVVEYAFVSRQLADTRGRVPGGVTDEVLRKKLHELYAELAPEDDKE